MTLLMHWLKMETTLFCSAESLLFSRSNFLHSPCDLARLFLYPRMMLLLLSSLSKMKVSIWSTMSASVNSYGLLTNFIMN